jgi:hypothetical protein
MVCWGLFPHERGRTKEVSLFVLPRLFLAQFLVELAN